ncbi:tripartite tricarboxylate transporter TctB family protein [Ancylobacter sp. A5.8]|uniref:tripartite tricarboxylate transporter TctB family protein n=1 Tax=Ancylobacter gelatini TaxID=2919920 RepID=UPI001F4E096B|nr:tripartite tricarboxylate transporter TctB family protein [Ancylobacter gelatini]MCJ8145313.1 tripartite tricarboxylate transporter TctB family protein [Ancylobacter gelatini]
MTRYIKNPKDVTAGLVLILLAALFAWLGSDLPFGRAVRMGPGYFPMILCGLLAFLGLIVVISGLGAADGDSEAPGFGAVSWRGLFFVTLAVVVFGLGIRTLGLGPSMGLAVFLSSLASGKFKLMRSLVMSAAMVAFSWAVFIKGLGLPLPMLGPWLGGY